MGLRERKNIDLIACPSCGRAEIDVIEVARQAQEAFGDRQIPLQVAVMGCVVNGPGEARDADLGIAAGKNKGHLFVRGQNVAVVPEDEMVDALVEWAEFIDEHGIDAALERAGHQRRGPPRGRAGPGRAARRAGRRRQPQRAAGRGHPQAGLRGPPMAGLRWGAPRTDAGVERHGAGRPRSAPWRSGGLGDCSWC